MYALYGLTDAEVAAVAGWGVGKRWIAILGGQATMNWSVLKTRIAAAVILGLAAGLTVWPLEASYAVKGPMLTFIGGAIVLVGLLPERPEWKSLIVIAGTATAVGGSWYWYWDATKGDGWLLASVIVVSVVLVGTPLSVIGIASFMNRRVPDEMERERRVVVRSLKRRLNDVVSETRQAGAHWPGGEHYEAYDFTINMLFLQTWSMLQNPYQWTYAPREHEDLIAWYVIERLRRTAEIAISKHPHQCKYGAIAYNLSEFAALHLYRINIITEIDPVPTECPECREPKPTHKVNCMAAICWRCKYPTPPRSKNSQNTTVFTPQCYSLFSCSIRGEELVPVAPIATRLKLPIGIPRGGEDQSLTGPLWPPNRGRLRQLLEDLNHD